MTTLCIKYIYIYTALCYNSLHSCTSARAQIPLSTHTQPQLPKKHMASGPSPTKIHSAYRPHTATTATRVVYPYAPSRTHAHNKPHLYTHKLDATRRGRDTHTNVFGSCFAHCYTLHSVYVASFYSYLACFMNTVTLNMYMFMLYTGLTRRSALFVFLWLRPRNTLIPPLPTYSSHARWSLPSGTIPPPLYLFLLLLLLLLLLQVI